MLQRQIYRLRKPRLRNVARAWKKISKKKKGGGWENGSERDRPEDHDTQTKTSPSAESARAGHPSTKAALRCHATPRGGALIFIQSATAYSSVKRVAACSPQIRFGRVKSNARDSKPERRPNPELVVKIATFLLQMNVGEDPTGRCKEQRRRAKLASNRTGISRKPKQAQSGDKVSKYHASRSVPNIATVGCALPRGPVMR